MRRWYGSLQDANNACVFSMAFDTKFHFGYPVYLEENIYTGVFVEWHTKSSLAIKAVELHLGPYVGIYPTKGLQGKACTSEHIFYFLHIRRREWTIGVRRDGFDVCTKYKILMGEAITKLAGGDKILEQSMKASVAREMRTKHSTNPVVPRKPCAEHSPVVPVRDAYGRRTFFGDA